MSLFRRRVDPAPEKRYGYDDYFTFGNQLYGPGNAYPFGQVQTTYGKNPAEAITSDFPGYIQGALRANGVVSAVEMVRFMVFSEARFQWQALNSGSPGKLFGTAELGILEEPWTGGTTGDLLARMILDADAAGNSYTARLDGELVRLRPDWTDIVLAPRTGPYGLNGDDVTVGHTKVGYAYYEGGKNITRDPAFFLPNEVAHFAPYPDPLATFRGMSWLTPVIREIQSDQQATVHKGKFWENAATANLHVALKQEMTPDQFTEFVDKMDDSHKGAANAYKTLYTAGGADVTVVGANMQQMDFAKVIGSGEIRIANAAGIHPVIVGLAEAMHGSSLNAGNYSAAKRSTVDRTFRPLWRNACGSLQVLLTSPAGGSSRLWIDVTDVAFLRDDESDLADIRAKEAQTIRTLLDAGFTADTVQQAVIAGDWALLQHSGLFSVQLQPPGTGQTPTAPAA